MSSNHLPGWGVLTLAKPGLLLLMLVFSLMSQQALSAWSVTEFQVMIDEPLMTEETLLVDALRESEGFTDSYDVAQKTIPSHVETAPG